MDSVNNYVVKDIASYLGDKFKDVDVLAEGDDVDIYQENNDLCKKILPLIEEYNESARTFLPRYFNIPDSIFEASCWSLDTIIIGRVTLINNASVKGFIMSYTYYPQNYTSIYDCFTINIKFKDNGWPVGLEFGPIF